MVMYNMKHGKSRTRLYHVWSSMLARCYCKTSRGYKWYGERGITVCDDWHDFTLFYEWATTNGYKEDLTLDRINVNGNYEPSNCRWTTMTTQERNRSNNSLLTFNGETKCISEWAEITGIPRNVISARIHKCKWDVERALTIPVGDTINTIVFDGKRGSCAYWEKITGIPANTISARLHRGWSVERALTQPMRGKNGRGS